MYSASWCSRSLYIVGMYRMCGMMASMVDAAHIQFYKIHFLHFTWKIVHILLKKRQTRHIARMRYSTQADDNQDDRTYRSVLAVGSLSRCVHIVWSFVRIHCATEGRIEWLPYLNRTLLRFEFGTRPNSGWLDGWMFWAGSTAYWNIKVSVSANRFDMTINGASSFWRFNNAGKMENEIEFGR